jgi:hypothetical protein
MTSIGMDRSRMSELTGVVRGRVEEAARHHEFDQSVKRFNVAIDEQWRLVFGMVSSGAHGWQLVSDDRGTQTLAQNAYCDDLGPLVFGNGWVMLSGGRWFRDGELAHAVAGLVSRRRSLADRVDNSIDQMLADDKRLGQSNGSVQFEAGTTEYAAVAERAAAFRDGFDAGRESSSGPFEVEVEGLARVDGRDMSNETAEFDSVPREIVGDVVAVEISDSNEDETA